MADGYLENRYRDYEQRKQQWLKKKKSYPSPDDIDPWNDR